jgi:uncharacterized protein YebE (UPF0316 family)
MIPNLRREEACGVMWSILLYFGLGLMLDLLITGHMRAIVLQRPWLASGLSVMITLLSMLVVTQLVVSNSLPLIFAYAAGCGAGTFLGMCLKQRKK